MISNEKFLIKQPSDNFRMNFSLTWIALIFAFPVVLASIIEITIESLFLRLNLVEKLDQFEIDMNGIYNSHQYFSLISEYLAGIQCPYQFQVSPSIKPWIFIPFCKTYVIYFWRGNENVRFWVYYSSSNKILPSILNCSINGDCFTINL
jgi:hypothetical protein